MVSKQVFYCGTILHFIKLFYAEDMDLCRKYHAHASETITPDECAEKTFEAIKAPHIKFFLVYLDGMPEPIGYYTEEILEEQRFVMSFFIRPAFRKYLILYGFWQHVLEGGNFYTSVSEKNSRAKSHLERNGFKEVNSGRFDELEWTMYKKEKTPVETGELVDDMSVSVHNKANI